MISAHYHLSGMVLYEKLSFKKVVHPMRNLSQFFTKQTLSYLVYLPKVFFVLKQPIHFLKSYITRTLSIERLDLRNGLMYEIANFDDLGVFYEIFIKREYGRIPQ